MAFIDPTHERIFFVLGLTGAGKSLFLNAISESDSCLVSLSKNWCTQKNKEVTFVYNQHRYNALDTPGLDDSDNNDEKIAVLKDILRVYPKIKKIIIVKKYNDLRFPLSMQNAIKSFMEAFPLLIFWNHVIIVNSWEYPHDESFQDYLEEPNKETFFQKILKCDWKNIKPPSELKEYYVYSKKVKKYSEISETFNSIKNDIKNSNQMFKDVRKSDVLESSRESKNNKGFYIVKKYRTLTCVDYDGKETVIEEIFKKKKYSQKLIVL